ncbi:MAG TPA: nuclear transport factor 2 family protein, partial [Candidatus Acidoferrum sp.]|nr:nuclear transport factor 2 family protein [Candidatus Acidoferrum sp.]
MKSAGTLCLLLFVAATAQAREPTLDDLYARFNMRTINSSFGPRLKFYCDSYPKDFFPAASKKIIPADNTLQLQAEEDVWTIKLLSPTRVSITNSISGGTYSDSTEYDIAWDETNMDWRANQTFIAKGNECVDYAQAKSAKANSAGPRPRLAALARTLDTAEATRNVKRLQWAYGHYSEFGLWYDFADLFADSGIGHYTQGDLNRDQIRALFYDQVGQGRLGLAQGRIYPHISFSPVVDVDADGVHAKARFRILAMLGGYGGNATWFHGVYENAYIKENGVWKHNEISNTAQITGNFKTGLSASSKPPLDQPTFAFHYAPEQVGNIKTAAQTVTTTADLPSLQQRTERLQDEAAIVNLQHQYGYYLDQHEWNRAADLFAERGTYESGQQGVYIGKASIRKALNQSGSNGAAKGEVIDEHILFQTYASIAPDGRTAKARVDQLGLQGTPGLSAQWTQGIYENTFVKERGNWRIQSIHYYPRVITDYAKGWGADAQPAPGPSTSNPPNAPPTEKYEIYPAFYIPPFHFPHPVTGRAPQYPPGDPAASKSTGFAPAVSGKTGPNGVPASLAMVELRAQKMLAVDAVENLVNAYAYYLDECQTQQAAALFADNGSNEIPGIGYYQGAQRIAASLQRAYCAAGRQEKALTLHHALQPIVTVSDDGQHATVV